MRITKIRSDPDRSTYLVGRGEHSYTLNLVYHDKKLTLSYADDSFWENYPLSGLPLQKLDVSPELFHIGGLASLQQFMDRTVPKYRTLQARIARLPKKDLKSSATFQDVPKKTRFRLKITAPNLVVAFSMPMVAADGITHQPIMSRSRIRKGLDPRHPGIKDDNWVELIELLDKCRDRIEEIPEEQFERIVALIGTVPVKGR